MPIFEYICDGCGHSFETLVVGSDKPACPKCGSENLKKQMSGFTAQCPGSPTPTAVGGGCGSGGFS